ncbi:hypothetical protein BDZ85DRAFT_270544 [Elsinoe ampelina]|uniref:Uncharacterized protein n=1 Tax=Elsinoe ampelina TaxID=302913 RepID=A0A6A6FYJ9_9PEZI|nr:hypothetical protein BDZ85DRAFT_270544 [Elsinoe ampelina]
MFTPPYVTMSRATNPLSIGCCCCQVLVMADKHSIKASMYAHSFAAGRRMSHSFAYLVNGQGRSKSHTRKEA